MQDQFVLRSKNVQSNLAIRKSIVVQERVLT